jgi:hypothetical protein
MLNSRSIFAVLAAWVWILLSEFVRNSLLFHGLWEAHYQSLGLTFPNAPENGAIWAAWSLVFAVLIFILSRRFSIVETFLLAWTMGFVLMWLVIGNLGVLPLGLLWFAVPLSLLEAALASWLVTKIVRPKYKNW